MDFETAYKPSLEIDPAKFLIVLGPKFTATVLNEIASEAVDLTKVALTSRQLVTIGIQLLLEINDFQSDAERSKCDTLYRNAYELDPLFAVNKLSSNLQKSGKYGEWLKRAFEVDLVLSNESSSLQRVKHLQHEGALVIYTHYDDVLSRLLQQKPILLNDEVNFDKWCKGKSNRILHVHGVYSQADTVVFDSDVYHGPSHPFKSAATQLVDIFCKRHVLMLGFDSEKHDEDPVFTKFTERYATDVPFSLHRLHLTRAKDPSDLSCLHNVTGLPTEENPVASLLPISTTSQAMWRQIEVPHATANTLTLSLLVERKDGVNEISKMVDERCPGINFVCVSSFTHNARRTHTLSLRVDKAKQKEVWEWLVHHERGKLLTKGLLAVVLHSGTFLWLRGRPGADSESQFIEQSQQQVSPPCSETIKFKEEPAPFDFHFPKSAYKRVDRYTMHPVRGRRQPYHVPGPSAALGKHVRPEVPLFGQHTSRAMLERRASLPVNTMNSSHVLDQLAHNLTPTPNHEVPSYVAIKQALLCDWYKRRRSIQADPKTLKFLLKSKVISEPLDLLKLRRYSDPGSYQPESFARRKELFIDENRTWSCTYGKVIEQKIAKWRLQREEKRQRDMLAWKNGEFSGLKYLLDSNASSPNPHVYSTGYSPVVYPVLGGCVGQPIYRPIYPYTLVNPYQPIMQMGQPTTTLYVPQPTSQQKFVYLVPPNSATSAASPALIPLNGSGQTLASQPVPPLMTRKKSDSSMREEEEHQIMRERFKRRQSVPNNLSSLLVSPLEPLKFESPPPAKRIHLSEEPHTSPSSQQQLSSRQHHLLQVHRTSHQRSSPSRTPSHSPQHSPLTQSYSPAQNGFDSDGSEFDEEEAEKIVGGAVSSPNAPRSQLQLWQFLLELLLISANTHLIQWSNNNYEFQINKPSDVAKLWGKVTCNENMDYLQLLKGLRYYFNRGIMSQVNGKPLSFRYNESIQSYIEMRRRSNLANQEELVVANQEEMVVVE